MLEVTVRCRDQAYVDLGCGIASNRPDLADIEDTQEFRLKFRGDVADFIQENGAAIRRFKKAAFLGKCACKCAFFVAEKFTLQETVCQGRTVNSHQGLVGALALGVYGARGEFFPGSAFTANQNCRRCRTDLVNQFDNFSSPLVVADNHCVAELLIEGVFSQFVLLSELDVILFKTFNRVREAHIPLCKVTINGYSMLAACGVAAGAAIQFILGVILIG